MLQAIDQYFLQLCGAYAHQSVLIDTTVVNTLCRVSYKLTPIIICVWLLWFAKNDRANARAAAARALTAGALALMVGRLIQNFHDKRPRPIHADNPDYVAPYGVSKGIMQDWSSFPSDHAALAFAMSAGVMSFSLPLGLLCMAWSLLVICLPRVYAGYHYATDIIAGMVIGLLVYLSIVCLRPLFDKLVACAEYLETRYTGAFYGAAFFMSLQLVTMFDDIRAPLSEIAQNL